MDHSNGHANNKRRRDWAGDEKSHKKQYQQRSKSKSTKSGSDDEKGHFFANPGFRFSERYEVIEELGKGTFGKVFRCHDSKYGHCVAIKVIRSIKRYIESARIEVMILNDVYKQQKAQKRECCVKLWSRFHFDGHYCLVFETLGMSLLDLIKMNNYKRLPLDFVRDVAKQLLEGMQFLKSMNLIHTDLKLENVMLCQNNMRTIEVDHRGYKYLVNVPIHRTIKLIDFGGATYDSDDHKSTIINTRQYRGPEVILELGWSFPSDIWSVGCLIAEVYCGELLFQTHEELEHLSLIEKCVGPFPSYMTNRGPYRYEYFNDRGTTRLEKLSKESRKHVHHSYNLDEFFTISPGDYRCGIVDLVRGLLTIDPSKRLKAEEALEFPFITGQPRSSSRSNSIHFSRQSSKEYYHPNGHGEIPTWLFNNDNM